MDIPASNWNEADASNSTAAPDGAPEGMAPSGVNDTIRAMMGASKRWYSWSTPRTTSGTATAYALAYSVAPGALVDGMTFMVQFHVTNGAAATLDVNLLGAKPLHYHAAGAWRVAPPGLIDTDEVLRVAYHDATGAFRLVGFRNGTGETREYAGSVAPAGSLLCDGAAYSRTEYAGLFAAIGTSHGAGDGSTTFNVPNHVNQFVRGGTPGTTGGAASTSTSISGSASGNVNINANTGAAFGAPTGFTLGSTVLPGDVHQHNLTASVPTTLAVSGSTGSINTVPPLVTENKIIRI